MTDRLYLFQTILHLTDGRRVEVEYTAPDRERAARAVTKRYQAQNPTARVAAVEMQRSDGEWGQRWLPHLDGWEHEQPDFIKAQTAERRDGAKPTDGTEL